MSPSDWRHTPVAQDDNKSVEAHLAMKHRMKGGPRKEITSLQVEVQCWPPSSTLPTEQATGSVGSTCWCGSPGCALRSHKRKLNPLFDEWLMGWPPNWTSVTVPIDCASWETESRRLLWHLLSRYWRSGLELPADCALLPSSDDSPLHA